MNQQRMDNFKTTLDHLKDVDCCFFSNIEESGFLETIAALNNSYGGTVFVGVKKNKKVVGCYPSEVIESIENLVRNKLSNIIQSEIYTLQEQNKFIVAITINQNKSKVAVIQMNKKSIYFFRLNGQSLEMNKIVEQKWKFEKENSTEILTEDACLLFDIIKSNQKTTLSMLYRLSNIHLKSERHR
jgi:predicted HTH transcriptional regulator